MKRKYFGTDGIRGRVDQSGIHAEFALKLGWAAGQVLKQQGKQGDVVVVGRDTRLSGPMLEAALQAGLSASGMHVKLLGVIPTPAIAFLTRSLNAAAGIVISASHNPYYDNGIKFFDHQGAKLSDELEHAIEVQLQKSIVPVLSEQLGCIDQVADAQGRYIQYCKETFPSQLSVSGLNIVIDAANGATFQVASPVFAELGATVTTLHHHPDGFNINQRCGATDVASLQEKVLSLGADVGVAFDGDGDRLIMVDHKGERVDGDELLAILADDYLNSARGCIGVVGTVMSNLGLEQFLQNRGVTLARTAVGDRYVLEEMKKRGWPLGGESSGHIINLDFSTTGDGIITALQVLRAMVASAKDLHTLKKVITKRPQILINVTVEDPKSWQQHPNIQKAISAAEKKLKNRGRILLRPSGTEPCIRVMVEGENKKEVQSIAESLASVVQQSMSISTH